MLLKRDEAWNTFQQVISESYNFIYLISAWVGPKFAKELENIAAAKEVIIVIRDLKLSNSKILQYLTNFDVRIYNPKILENGKEHFLHSKILISDTSLMVGSANFTYTSFFKEENHIQYYDNLAPEWSEFYQYAKKIIDESEMITPLSLHMDSKKVDINEKIRQFENHQKTFIKKEDNRNNNNNTSKKVFSEIQLVSLPETGLHLNNQDKKEETTKTVNTNNNFIENILRLFRSL